MREKPPTWCWHPWADEITICGEIVKNVKVGRSLRLLVSDDLTWMHQIEKVVKSCREKLSGLWKCTDVLNEPQRTIKADAIIIPRLCYCLEVVSTGRKKDMENGKVFSQQQQGGCLKQRVGTGM